ncbi:E3 ubiquitin ligase [Culex quinquefasciatus]|uniref:E3 ubiquitin ligase n=1 Tax=Culex quinquefasciatus TaxID=7176 RepID=B0WD65_CULQU|nr:E3 ubiquitin ligase [Culex quinquefasciatus]|eukprot:XP_001846649.1 E3 ubiquitin ligase [Culex quinquefasciatus]
MATQCTIVHWSWPAQRLTSMIGTFESCNLVMIGSYSSSVVHGAILEGPGLPDPFAKIRVDGTAQEYKTDICKASLEPKWNTHYDLYLGKNDSVTISIWNQRKVQKRQGSGFLGCVRIPANTIQSLKDTGCE